MPKKKDNIPVFSDGKAEKYPEDVANLIYNNPVRPAFARDSQGLDPIYRALVNQIPFHRRHLDIQILYGPWSILNDEDYPRIPAAADWIHRYVHIVIFRNAISGQYNGIDYRKLWFDNVLHIANEYKSLNFIFRKYGLIS